MRCLGNGGCPDIFYPAPRAGDADWRAVVNGENKKRTWRKPSPFESMVGEKGFEPSTPCTPCKCATRLRYTPTRTLLYAKHSTTFGSWRDFPDSASSAISMHLPRLSLRRSMSLPVRGEGRRRRPCRPARGHRRVQWPRWAVGIARVPGVWRLAIIADSIFSARGAFILHGMRARRLSY